MAMIRYQRTSPTLDVYIYHDENYGSVHVTNLDDSVVKVTTMPLHDGVGNIVATIVTFPNGESMTLGTLPEELP